jgi:hypothetical protein
MAVEIAERLKAAFDFTLTPLVCIIPDRNGNRDQALLHLTLPGEIKRSLIELNHEMGRERSVALQLTGLPRNPAELLLPEQRLQGLGNLSLGQMNADARMMA